MSFTKTRQSAGSFSVDLGSSLPHSQSQQLSLTAAGFAHVVVTPTRMAVDELDWTSLRGLSIYTGVLRKRSDRTVLEGAHCTIWLGDEDKKGNIEDVVTSAGQTFQFWVGALRKSNTGAGVPQLDAGSVEALGGSFAATYHWDTAQATSRRDQLGLVCDWAGAEFRVNDDLTLDAGTASYLYGTTPTVMLTPTFEGRDSGLTSIRCTFSPSEDVEDWTSDVVYQDAGGGHKQTGTKTYLNGLGTDALWIRRLDLDGTQTAALNGVIGAAQLTRFQSIRQTLDVRSDAEAIFMDVNPGDRVYAYDPDTDVYDLAVTPVYFRGELVNPAELVVESVTMPMSADMGLYVRLGDGTLLDMSDWYVPESGGASMTVGDRPQSIRAAVRSRSGPDLL